MLVFVCFVGEGDCFVFGFFVCLLGGPVPVTGFTGDTVILISLRVQTEGSQKFLSL